MKRKNGKPRIIVMGSFVADLMGRGPQIPVAGETVRGTFFKVGPGGKGSNQAVAAARAGGNVAMVSKLGMDDFGEMALANLVAEGIDTSRVLRTADHPTGAALIMVDEVSGQNSIMVIPGACAEIGADEAADAVRSLGSSGILVVQLETNMPAVAASLREAREMGMQTVCNPAPAHPIPPELFPLIDYLTPNETEAATLADVPVDDIEGAAKAARILQGMGAANVIVTLGEKGALILDRSGAMSVVGPYRVKAVDTTGAGDSFNGAFALALAEGRSLEAATAFANAAAALSVTRIGTAPSMPTRAEIDGFIAANGDPTTRRRY